ncbi:MAG: TRAP transporter large permease subunit [Gammaproteobacteria bacterium]|nr:TRAP transporter large permease subunit [Gammaproteobacteria bacterium]
MAVNEILDVLMFVALCAAILAGFPVAFTIAGVSLVFAGLGTALGVFNFDILSAFPQRIFGIMTNQVLIAVPLFIFMGVMLERSRVAEQLLDSMALLFGRLRGGLGISVCLVGALMAASTGIVGATVVTMGLMALPTMLRHGYSGSLSCGMISAAGTLGQIIPPSIVLIILADVMATAYQQAQLEQGNFAPQTVSVGDLFAGALIPGLCLVALYMLYQLAIAFFRPSAAPALRDEDIPEAARGRIVAYALKALIPPLVLMVAVLGSILGGIATPTEAAAVGAVGAILLAGHHIDPGRGMPTIIGALSLIGLLVLTATLDLRLNRALRSPTEAAGVALAFLFCAGAAWSIIDSLRRTWRNGVLTYVVRSTTQLTSMVFVILVGAALFTVVFRGLGGDGTVRSMLETMPGGVAGAMVIVMAALFILGFFLDFIEITLVVVPIVAPALLVMGVDPVWLAIMIAVNLQTSFLTPPFGFALFYLRGVMPPEMRTIELYRGVAPFVLIQLASLGLLALFPDLVTWLPGVLFGR